MTRRRKLVLAGAMAVAVVVAVWLPGAYWPVVGWWRGEAFYDGRPTSYYAAHARAHRVYVTVTASGAPAGYYCQRAPGPLDALARRLGRQRPVTLTYYTLPQDPAAALMLVELLDASRGEPAVRLQAAMALGNVRPLGPDAVAALRRAAEDEACWQGTNYLPFVQDALRRAELDAREPLP